MVLSVCTLADSVLNVTNRLSSGSEDAPGNCLGSEAFGARSSNGKCSCDIVLEHGSESW